MFIYLKVIRLVRRGRDYSTAVGFVGVKTLPMRSRTTRSTVVRGIQAGGQWARDPMRPLSSAPLSRRAPQLCHYAVQFLNELARTAGPKDFRNLVVIPQRPLFTAFEALPHRIAMGSQIGENLASVVEFVRRRHEAYRGICIAQMLQVFLLSFEPGRFRLGIGVGASLDDVRDPFAKLPPDFPEPPFPALVLHGIVQQCRDRLILVAAMRQHRRGHAQKVCDIGPRGSLAELCSVEPGRIAQRPLKSRAQRAVFAVVLTGRCR